MMVMVMMVITMLMMIPDMIVVEMHSQIADDGNNNEGDCRYCRVSAHVSLSMFRSVCSVGSLTMLIV